MSSRALAIGRGEALRLARACAGLLILSAGLGVSANRLRPAATRLPWVGDWEHHIENKAFRAGLPVALLHRVRERVEDPSGAILDARPPAEYQAGHLPRALSLPVADAEQRIGAYVDRLTPQTPLLVYCGGGDCIDGFELALKLREFGFTDVTLYPGGYAEWTTYGGATRTGAQP